VSHWCRRLVETLAALILSKLVIVATLSLAAGAVSSGTAGTGSHGSGFSAVLAGGALLLMATFTPFAILRLIPAVESGAVGHLEGLRQRGSAALTQLPRSAASHVLHEGLGALGDARLMAQTAGVGGPGVGGAARATTRPWRPGADSRSNGSGNGTGADGDGASDLLAQVTPENGGLVSGPDGLALGNPESQKIYDDAIARGLVPPPKGPKPILQSATDGDRAGADRDDASTGSPSKSPQRNASMSGVSMSGPLATPFRPATSDAWKSEGVPPGYRLIGPVEPGKMRHCLGDDGHGPQIKWLPAVWPPGEGPES
jgi:hypothetical protein